MTRSPVDSPAVPPGPAISLAYSVDADDAFMFHALRAGRIDTRGLAFTHRRADTAELNALAAGEGADVVAVSLGAYPTIASSYLLLPHGASVGRGFGPIVVAKRPLSPEDLAGKRVGIPGTSTTAWLVLRLIAPSAVPVVVPIAPFSRAFDALDAGEIDAALLIHEGRLLYEAKGYVKVVELGEWWHAETGLPLPLGVNVIRRGLGASTVAAVSELLREAIRWALAHRDEVIRVIAAEDRGDAALADPALLDRYLSMYANDDTAEMASDVRRAIDILFARARSAALLDAAFRVDWAP
jgi:1,4-dihydroxy-6-naphthoate synthase